MGDQEGGGEVFEGGGGRAVDDDPRQTERLLDDLGGEEVSAGGLRVSLGRSVSPRTVPIEALAAGRRWLQPAC